MKLESQPSRVSELAALVLAIASLLLGLVAAGMIPDASLSGAFTPASLASALVVIAGGAVLPVPSGCNSRRSAVPMPWRRCFTRCAR